MKKNTVIETLDSFGDEFVYTTGTEHSCLRDERSPACPHFLTDTARNYINCAWETLKTINFSILLIIKNIEQWLFGIFVLIFIMVMGVEFMLSRCWGLTRWQRGTRISIIRTRGLLMSRGLNGNTLISPNRNTRSAITIIMIIAGGNRELRIWDAELNQSGRRWWWRHAYSGWYRQWR